ncbi:MAG: cytochrome P450, partial [Novosphingobium sp.]|nr:cytochrome P450 [Novosphingobium sp.]
MATTADRIVPEEIGRAVIDPAAYAAWDPLLDQFDTLREEGLQVARVVSSADLHEPFWLVSGFDEVMAASKDNTTFLNHPKSSVFALRSTDAL